MILLLHLACASPASAPEQEDSGGSPPCAYAVSLLDVTGAPTGFERCEEGGVNRVGPWQGSLETYADTYGEPWVTGEVECTQHSDCAPEERCTQKDLGHCIYTGPRCERVCASNDDCGLDEVCVPPEPHDGRPEWPTCVSAGCQTGADCASGECALIWSPLDVDIALSCRSPDDTCRSNADCARDNAVFCALAWCSSDIPCE